MGSPYHHPCWFHLISAFWGLYISTFYHCWEGGQGGRPLPPPAPLPPPSRPSSPSSLLERRALRARKNSSFPLPPFLPPLSLLPPPLLPPPSPLLPPPAPSSPSSLPLFSPPPAPSSPPLPLTLSTPSLLLQKRRFNDEYPEVYCMNTLAELHCRLTVGSGGHM